MVILVTLVGAGLLASPSVFALTPDSPEVKAAVARGMKFLSTAPEDPRAGAKALYGRVLLYDRQYDHPKVLEAAAAVKQELAMEPIGADIYTVGLSLLFLVEYDPVTFRPEIEKLLRHLATVQKPHGGWGYPHLQTGDTSMTQYAVLSMWTAANAGFDTPMGSWTKVTNWLLRTQAPDGGFSYQGNDPGKYEPIHQDEVYFTMVAAGLGSLYLCADHLGFQNLTTVNTDLSSEFKPVVAVKSTPRTKDVDASRLSNAIANANAWLRGHASDKPTRWHCYGYYTAERMYTFRDAAGGKTPPEPAWYDDGVHELLKLQKEGGHWEGEEQRVPATSFAILFLIRSTQKTLAKVRSFGAGTLVGGRGLPANSSEVVLRMGHVVAKPLTGPAEELLARIEDPTHPDYLRAVEGLEDLSQSADEQTLSAVAKRLRRVAGHASPEARAAALSALARTRNLDDVPLLIEALNDPDPGVFRAARQGLQFISRRISVAARSEQPSGGERAAEIAQWKKWYRSVRPDADFEN
jgi:hypothetical protein